jgi:hypothetical protein
MKPHETELVLNLDLEKKHNRDQLERIRSRFHTREPFRFRMHDWIVKEITLVSELGRYYATVRLVR